MMTGWKRLPDRARWRCCLAIGGAPAVAGQGTAAAESATGDVPSRGGHRHRKTIT